MDKFYTNFIWGRIKSIFPHNYSFWKVGFLISFLTAGGVFNSFGQNQDNFSGAFINRETNLLFKVSRHDSNYSCIISFQDQTFHFNAGVILGILSGQYEYQGKQVAVTFTKVLNNYFLISEGYTIPMERDDSITIPKSTSTVTSPDGTKKLNDSAWPLSSDKITPASGTTITDPYGRYQLKIPIDWKLEGSQSYLNFKKDGTNAVLTIYPHLLSDIASAMRDLKNLYDPDAGTDLKVYPVKLAKDRYIVRMNGKVDDKSTFVEYACLFSPHGGGLFINFNLMEDDYQNAFDGLVQSVMATVTFLNPVMTPEAIHWQKKLTGKKLLYLNTDRYGTMRTDLDLFDDGTYSYVNESSRLSTGYTTLSYAGRTTHSGKWNIQMKSGKPVLWLCEERAEFYEYPISGSSNSENEIYLGARKFFIQ